jgi:hypothetical protein
MSATTTETLEGDQRDQEKVAAREAWDDGRARRHDPPDDRWSLGKIWALEPGGVPGLPLGRHDAAYLLRSPKIKARIEKLAARWLSDWCA